MANLRLSLRLLTKHFNGVYRYPVLLAHDVPLTKGARRELAALARPARLSFARVVNELPGWIRPEEVPASVMGFSVDYRFMIRWKVRCLYPPHPCHSFSPPLWS